MSLYLVIPCGAKDGSVLEFTVETELAVGRGRSLSYQSSFVSDVFSLRISPCLLDLCIFSE